MIFSRRSNGARGTNSLLSVQVEVEAGVDVLQDGSDAIADVVPAGRRRVVARAAGLTGRRRRRSTALIELGPNDRLRVGVLVVDYSTKHRHPSNLGDRQRSDDLGAGDRSVAE